MLAADLGVSLSTLKRYLNQLEIQGYIFTRDKEGRLFLQQTGWDRLSTLKDATIRQMEILRFVNAHLNGVKGTDIMARFTVSKDEKTIGRDLKELEKRELITNRQGVYVLNASLVLPPLQLDAAEKSLLLEDLAVLQEMSPRKDEAKSLTAKLQISLNLRSNEPEIIAVHGRRPSENLRRSYYCQRLEEYARTHSEIVLLYRRDEEAAYEVKVNPLGILYYWALDNWYLVAVDEIDQTIKTYSLDRILSVEETGKTLVLPNGFDLENWFKYAWGVYRSGSPVKVKIRFRNYYTTIQRVKDELIYRETCSLQEDGDDLIMVDTVDGLSEIAVWLRSFGQGAEVVEPLELREAVITDLEQILSNYGGL
jgi:predicted DNA-binding transcriptional regulator YafY